MNPWTIAAISLASFGLGIAFAAWLARNKPAVVILNITSEGGRNLATIVQCAGRIAHETKRAQNR